MIDEERLVYRNNHGLNLFSENCLDIGTGGKVSSTVLSELPTLNSHKIKQKNSKKTKLNNSVKKIGSSHPFIHKSFKYIATKPSNTDQVHCNNIINGEHNDISDHNLNKIENSVNLNSNKNRDVWYFPGYIVINVLRKEQFYKLLEYFFTTNTIINEKNIEEIKDHILNITQVSLITIIDKPDNKVIFREDNKTLLSNNMIIYKQSTNCLFCGRKFYSTKNLKSHFELFHGLNTLNLYKTYKTTEKEVLSQEGSADNLSCVIFISCHELDGHTLKQTFEKELLDNNNTIVLQSRDNSSIEGMVFHEKLLKTASVKDTDEEIQELVNCKNKKKRVQVLYSKAKKSGLLNKLAQNQNEINPIKRKYTKSKNKINMNEKIALEDGNNTGKKLEIKESTDSKDTSKSKSKEKVRKSKKNISISAVHNNLKSNIDNFNNNLNVINIKQESNNLNNGNGNTLTLVEKATNNNSINDINNKTENSICYINLLDSSLSNSIKKPENNSSSPNKNLDNNKLKVTLNKLAKKKGRIRIRKPIIKPAALDSIIVRRRPYYHSISGEPISDESNYEDSENELNEVYEFKKELQTVFDFSDICDNEKKFFAMWNEHINKLNNYKEYEAIIAIIDCHTKTKYFIEHYFSKIIKESLLENLGNHLIMLYDAGKLNKDQYLDINNLITQLINKH
jgi:hypothetical protein